MADPSAKVTLWVGAPQRAEGVLCVECFTSALVWVPYYTYTGSDVLELNTKLSVFRRVMCSNCGLVRNINA